MFYRASFKGNTHHVPGSISAYSIEGPLEKQDMAGGIYIDAAGKMIMYYKGMVAYFSFFYPFFQPSSKAEPKMVCALDANHNNIREFISRIFPHIPSEGHIEKNSRKNKVFARIIKSQDKQ